MNYDPTEWVSANIAGMIARRLGIPHSNDRVKAQMQAEQPATVRRKSEHRDELLLGPYIEMARRQSDAQRAIEAEAEQRRKAREAAQAEAKVAKQTAVESELKALRDELASHRQLIVGTFSDLQQMIICPECGSDYSHMLDAGFFAGTDEREGGIPVGAKMLGHTQHRRHAVGIKFHCECCSNFFWLSIQQHKGQNFVEVGLRERKGDQP